tara:strand:+ start:3305 stop:3673 length:369 start_codon:yes stop_codon:yes gene_type:complete
MNSIFIPGNTPSSKNSQQWTGRYLVKSKTTQRYVKDSKWHYATNKKEFKKMLKGKKKPYNIEFTFYRKTKRKFDYINAAQIVQDLMVKHGWIDDDNCTEMKPYFGNYVHQKDNPGVFIKVLK